MSSLVTLKRLQVATPPLSAGGEALRADFQTIDNLVLFNQGIWSNTRAYVPNDLVLSQGNYYLCLAANTGDLPPSGNWQAFAPASYQAQITLAYGVYGNPLDINTDGSGTIQLTDGTTDRFSGDYTANTPGFGNGKITLRGSFGSFLLGNTGKDYVIGVLLPGFDPGSGATNSHVDVSGCNLNAYAINALFDSLGHNGGLNAAIDVSGNPGSATCDPSIASNKGWTVLT